MPTERLFELYGEYPSASLNVAAESRDPNDLLGDTPSVLKVPDLNGHSHTRRSRAINPGR